LKQLISIIFAKKKKKQQIPFIFAKKNNLLKQTLTTQNTTALNSILTKPHQPFKQSVTDRTSVVICIPPNFRSKKQKRIIFFIGITYKVYFIGMRGSFWDTISNSTTETNDWWLCSMLYECFFILFF
jgi:hypothetical protein